MHIFQNKNRRPEKFVVPINIFSDKVSSNMVRFFLLVFDLCSFVEVRKMQNFSCERKETFEAWKPGIKFERAKEKEQRRRRSNFASVSQINGSSLSHLTRVLRNNQ